MSTETVRRETVAMTLDDIGDLVTTAFERNSCDGLNTAALVRTIVSAERDGSLSHGLFRVPGYIAALRSGKVNGKANPTVVHTSPVIIHVYGDGGFAPLALERGVAALASTAKQQGVAVMALTRTHHFASLWHETEALAEQGLVAMACVCYMPVAAPMGGKVPLFGSNPISFAWPRPGAAPAVFDMATTAMSRGEVQMAAREGRSVPPGTGLDANGNLTTNPVEILTGALLPFGGHKGSAIALMVELLAAGAVGEQFSFEAAETDNGDGGPPSGGEFVLAFAPDLLAGPGWADHCEKFFRRFEAIEGARLPGSRRHRNRMFTGPRSIDVDLLTRIQSLCD
jgi:delta1-piperideine-2-carboxylate reductase